MCVGVYVYVGDKYISISVYQCVCVGVSAYMIMLCVWVCVCVYDKCINVLVWVYLPV